jgi:hypothetical protein
LGENVKNLVERLDPELKNMMGAGRLEPEVYSQLLTLIQHKQTEWTNEMAEELKQKAKDWEEIMGPEKEGFYSLALRRSADFIIGRSALDE